MFTIPTPLGRSVSAGPVAGVVSAVNGVHSEIFSLNTATGNQTFTIPDIGGYTPKAALFEVVATSNAADTAGGRCQVSFGLADGTSQSAFYGSPQGYQRRALSTRCILGYDGTTEYSASFVSFSTNAVTVNINTAPGAALKVKVTLFWGNDLQAKVLNQSGISTGGTAMTVGYQAEAIIALANNVAFGDVASAFGNFSYGFCANDGSLTQAGVCCNATSALGVNQQLLTPILAQLANGGASYDYTVSITGISSTQITATASASGAASDGFSFLALSWGGNADIDVGTFAAPTSTGNSSKTGVGFQPTDLFALPIADTTQGTGYINGVAQGSAHIKAGAIRSLATASAINGTSPSSIWSNTSMRLRDHTGSLAVATLTSFDADGWTLNYSTAPGSAYLFPYLAFRF